MTEAGSADDRAAHMEVRALSEEHVRVTAVVRQLEAMARDTAEQPSAETWCELRCSFVDTALVLLDHTAREEVVLRRALEGAGWGVASRLATMVRAHDEQLAKIRRINAELARAPTPPAAALAEEITWLAAMIHQDLEQEVALYEDALPRLREDEGALPCSDVMRHPVRWVSESDTARTAARVMRDANVGFLVVCDGSARVVGTLTDRDLVTRLLAEDGSNGVLVSSIMTREAVCCRPTDDVSIAEDAMMRHQKARIVIADDAHHAVGIISIDDIAQRYGPRIGDVLRHVHGRHGGAIRPALPAH